MMHTIMVWTGIGFVFFALTMLAFIDVARKEFKSSRVKMGWGIVTLIPVVGWLVYFLFGFWQGRVMRHSD